MIEIIIWCIAAYLLGSFPSSYVITKLAKGIDIREHGSRNPGATNVYRVAGLVPGILTFVADMLKGFIPVFLAVRFADNGGAVTAIVVGLSAIAGHMWTVFLNFKGGKGVATACGVFFALLPLPALCAFVTFWIVCLISRYVSLSSIIAAAVLPAVSFYAGEPRPLSVFALGVALLVIVKHKPNMVRLMNGTEHRFGAKKPSDNKETLP